MPAMEAQPTAAMCALSSVEEHFLHTEGVAGSSPAARTIHQSQMPGARSPDPLPADSEQDEQTGILQIRAHGQADRETLVYLPGLHGDWTLIPAFRAEVIPDFHFLELTYPRTRTWSLDDYARAILDLLACNGISSGWLIGESFGSQVMWAIVKRCGLPRIQTSTPTAKNTAEPGFTPRGLILAGGFVRHPVPAGVWCAYRLFRMTPPLGQTLMRSTCQLYGWLRHWNSPENRRHMDEFVARRTALDWAAATHRLRLITESDPRDLARRTTLPVYHLAGLIDPIVPGPWIRHWLRKNCPGYRGGKTLYAADHNVLGTAPRAAARCISHWIERR
jgi:pimeloyl-ACP methyl ester carboxylesterase